MNLGIVIAVSDYNLLGSDLPGCAVDGKAISTILKTDNKFDEVLVITDNTSSGDVKSKLIEFISRNKKNEIDDVVFYFTGHGDFSGDEFYYLLSDYDNKRKKQTSLENTELDNLLRTLNPSNTVKIVDACHSGTAYIKDPDAFDTYLKSTQGEFKKCYFMFSSQSDQYSYQDSYLSDFTKSIVESIHSHTSNIIRYKDIIDYVSDAFSGNSSQTPFFIVQADFTESFCTVSDTLKKSISDLLEGKDLKDIKLTNTEKTLLELIQADADKYCNEEEAVDQLKLFIDIIKKLPLSKKINDIYQTNYQEESDYNNIPNANAIGKWLDNNDNELFAKVITEKIVITKKVRKKSAWANGSLRYLGGLDDDENNYKTVKVPQLYVAGFNSTIDLPLTMLKIIAEPKFPNIAAAAGYIVPILSKTNLQVFVSFDFFEEQGWEEKKISNSIKWIAHTIELKNKKALETLSEDIVKDFSSFLLIPLLDKFGLNENSEKDEVETVDTAKLKKK